MAASQNNEMYVEAKKIYDECKDLFSYFDTSGWKNMAQEKEESDFYMMLNDFFIQQRQKELIQKGIC